jgi:hypothetical protein
MTNTQLYLAVGIPMLVLIAAMVMSILHMSGIRGDLYGIRGEIRQTRSDIDKLSRQIEESVRGLHTSIKQLASIQPKKEGPK